MSCLPTGCNDDVPELLSLATTVSRWEDEVVCAVLTGVTNAASESMNRLAKLEAAWHSASVTPQTSAGASASPAPGPDGVHYAAQPPVKHGL